jgi:hypothetical protein
MRLAWEEKQPVHEIAGKINRPRRFTDGCLKWGVFMPKFRGISGIRDPRSG